MYPSCCVAHAASEHMHTAPLTSAFRLSRASESENGTVIQTRLTGTRWERAAQHSRVKRSRLRTGDRADREQAPNKPGMFFATCFGSQLPLIFEPDRPGGPGRYASCAICVARRKLESFRVHDAGFGVSFVPSFEVNWRSPSRDTVCERSNSLKGLIELEAYRVTPRCTALHGCGRRGEV